MTLEEMKKRKKELGYSAEMLSHLSGVPLGTIQKVFSGATASPRYSTLQALEAVLKRTDYNPDVPRVESLLLQDVSYNYGSTAKKLTGEDTGDNRKTIDDYYKLPDNVRVELIDGVFFFMNAPTRLHQELLLKLGFAFQECVEAHSETCEVAIAPCDVQLDRDRYTMVQPDIYVVCNDTSGDPKKLPGAPDLTVEILSPSTRSKDLYLKLHKYQNAGVREYWIVDPENQKVTVYVFDRSDYPDYYTFDDVIPIAISDGKCSIDFHRIKSRLHHLPAGS